MSDTRIPPSADGPTPEAYTELGLLPQHALQLAESGVNPDVARERGYRSVTKKTALREYGFAGTQVRVPALVMPIRDMHGEIVTYQSRPDDPRVDRRTGRLVKYETPARTSLRLDVPQRARTLLQDIDTPLFVTEGTKKVDAGVSHGLGCIGVPGVYGWRSTSALGGTTALPDLEFVAWKGRDGRRRLVYLVFDSDAMSKREVYVALKRFRAVLERLGADVRIVYLPPKPDGRKAGLDDFLAAGGTVDQLVGLSSEALRAPPGVETEDGPYVHRSGGIFWLRGVSDGCTEPIQLTNFAAEIVADVTLDDGADQRRYFEVRAKCGDVEAEFRVTPTEFTAMSWPIEHLGAEAWVAPGGRATADRARVAIQELSGHIVRRVSIGHAGWRTIDGKFVFVHAGGAVGAEGLVEGVDVDLPGQLALYHLPSPPNGDELRTAVNAVIRMLSVAPERITFALIAAIARAVIGNVDFAVHLEGESGTFKSELAALAQQFFGADMTARHLPGAWSGTANSLELLAYAAKDSVFVVDDFVPRGSAGDVRREHAKAERLLRAQGNQAGRSRMKADTSLRTTYYPRGLILSTGEDVPAGQSLLARMLVLHVVGSSVNAATLTECQQAASAGIYASFTSAWIKWLARHLDAVRDEVKRLVVEIRASLGRDRPHRRTLEIEADLVAALKILGRFLEEAGGLRAADVQRLLARGNRAIADAVDDHGRRQAECAPHDRFVELLRQVIASGRGHLALRDGTAPASPTRWGWRLEGAGEEQRERPLGDRIGYVDDQNVYLLPDATYAAVSRLAESGGAGLGVTPQTLWKRLKGHDLLASTDSARQTNTVRRVLEDRPQAVLHLRASALGIDSRRQDAEVRLFDDSAGEGCAA